MYYSTNLINVNAGYIKIPLRENVLFDKIKMSSVVIDDGV
jgi:hypothetical protein